jgi:hypothetical protein
MLLLAALVLGLLFRAMTGGGSVTPPTRFRWRGSSLLRWSSGGGGLQPAEPDRQHQYVYAAALAAIIGWTMWHVKRLRGVWIVASPQSDRGARQRHADASGPALAGHLVESATGQYVVMAPGTNLAWLGDWIGIPARSGALTVPATWWSSPASRWSLSSLRDRGVRQPLSWMKPQDM